MGLVNAKARLREETYDLKSLPEGWVKIRRFDHGERIDRLSKILVMTISEETGEQGEAHIDHRAARLHDFAKAVVDHNLGDGNGKKYNFSNTEDVFAIDGEVGDEINDFIAEHQEVIPDIELPKLEENSPVST